MYDIPSEQADSKLINGRWMNALGFVLDYTLTSMILMISLDINRIQAMHRVVSLQQILKSQHHAPFCTPRCMTL